MESAPRPINLFYSCSPADEDLRLELEKHLAALGRDGLIASWHAQLVPAGADNSKTINEKLEQAAIILLLISSDFLASDYCSGEEVRRAVERHERGESVVVPVLLRPCDWTTAPFARLRALPRDERPIVKWEVRDDAYLDVARGVRAAVHRLRDGMTQEPSAAPPPEPKRLDRELVDELERLILEREATFVDEARTNAITRAIDATVRELSFRERPRAGDQIAGTELVKQIGSGSFATVWLAKQLGTGRLRATKIFNHDLLAQGVMLWRFRRGIRAMMHLARRADLDPHIVRLQNVDDSTLAFSMDYASEGNLENIERRGWTLAKKIEAVITLCVAVEFAHANGIIHRDIKPANIVLDKNHEPVLTDFDVADIKFAATLSAVQSGLGTPMFASPEQFLDSSKADERSDIYSIGRMLYFLLLERSPGLQIEIDPSLQNLSSFPVALVSVVRKATQYDPELRYGSVAQLRQAIAGYQTRGALLAASLGRAVRVVRKNAALSLGLTAVVVGALVYAKREHSTRQFQEEINAQLTHLRDESDDSMRVLVDMLERKTRVQAEARRVEQVIAKLDLKIASSAPGDANDALIRQRDEHKRALASMEDNVAQIDSAAIAQEAKLEKQRQQQATVLQQVNHHPTTTPAVSEPGSEEPGWCTCASQIESADRVTQKDFYAENSSTCAARCGGHVVNFVAVHSTYNRGPYPRPEVE